MKIIAIALLLAGTTPAMARPIVEERRTFYPDGRPFEIRHFLNGREEGMQQVWTEEGELYISYDMRNGRRYGFINARPCNPVKETK